jgi:hypothetical protein
VPSIRFPKESSILSKRSVHLYQSASVMMNMGSTRKS